MPRVLLSGGIGSGKSEVGRLLAERGAHVVEADRVGHAVLAPGGEVAAEVARRWPEAVRDGAIDRVLLARQVFDDPEELRELEAITHPHIARRIREEVDASPARVVVVELPLARDLLGPGWLRVVVAAPLEARVARLAESGWTEEEVLRRVAAQPSREEWLGWADHVVDNSGDLKSLEREVERLWEWLGRDPQVARAP